MDISAEILKANCLHNGCFQKYRRVGRHSDWGFGGAPQHGPVPAVLTAPLLDQSCWERCEESSQTAFILPPDPPPLHPSDYTAYWATQHTAYPPFTSWHSSLCMIFPLFNGFPYFSCQDYSSSSPSPLISSPLIVICLLSLSGLWDYCVVIFQWASIWKSWTSWGIPANASYWFTLLWRGPLFLEVDCSACCCPSLGSNAALCL